VGSLLGGSQQLRHGITRLGGAGGLTDAYLAAAFGLMPRWSVACGWLAVAVAGLIELFGSLFSLPQRMLDISPFTHLPKLPGRRSARRRWPGCRRPPRPWPPRGWPDSAAAISAEGPASAGHG
jgi:hypothetical protein